MGGGSVTLSEGGTPTLSPRSITLWLLLYAFRVWGPWRHVPLNILIEGDEIGVVPLNNCTRPTQSFTHVYATGSDTFTV